MIEDHWVSIISIVMTVLIALYLRRIPDELNKAIARVDAKIDKGHMTLADEIKEIKRTVVFLDVFEQSLKTQDARHQTTEKVYKILAEQMKATATQNTREHERICGKMDAVSLMVKDELDRYMLNNKN